MAESFISGINSNLDTADIVNKLIQLQRRPIDDLEAKADLEAERILVPSMLVEEPPEQTFYWDMVVNSKGLLQRLFKMRRDSPLYYCIQYD